MQVFRHRTKNAFFPVKSVCSNDGRRKVFYSKVKVSEYGGLEEHLLLNMDDLFDRLDAVGTKLEKDVKICMHLRSLPPSFDGIVIALDSRSNDDLPDTLSSATAPP